MKHLLFAIATTAVLASCNNDPKADTPAADSTGTGATISAPDSVPPPPPPAAAVKDSVMQLKDGKVVISIGGTWSPLTAAVTTSNGRKVSPDGEVSKGKVKRKLEEGMMIDKDGQMTDKDGKMLDNTGWE